MGKIAKSIVKLAFGLLFLYSASCFSQTNVVKLVVGYPSGQSVDIVARALAARLGPALGRSFFVDNVPGQSGSIALAEFAKMPADGSVLALSASAALAGNPVLYKNVRYDSLKDFEPVGLIYDAPLLLLVNSSVPVNSLKELLAYLKAHPDKLSYSSPGVGSVSQLAMAELMRRTGIEMIHVPYQGSVRSLTDLAAGFVQVSFDTITASEPFLASGKVKVLAVSSKERVSRLPNVPTIAESGIPDFDLVPWVGLLAPAGTPKDLVDKVSLELAKIVRSEEFTKRLSALGLRPLSSTAPEFKVFLRAEMNRWASVIRNSGIKPE